MPESPASEPRRRTVLLWFVGGVFGSAILGCVLLWFALFGPRGNGIPIGPETTIYDGPLDEHGYVDYAAIFNNEPFVPPEDNAAGCYVTVFMDRVRESYEPAEFQKLCDTLGIEPLADENNPWLFSDLTDEYWREPMTSSDGSPNDETRESMFYSVCQDTPWTREQYSLISEWLDANEQAFEKLVEGTRRGQISRFAADNAPDLYKPPSFGHGHYRELARYLKSRAMRAIGEQDWSGATKDVDALHDLSRHRFQLSTILDLLVSYAVFELTFNTERQLIARLPSVELVNARRRKIASMHLFDDLLDVLNRRERFFALDGIQLIDRTARELVTDGHQMIDLKSNIWLPEHYRDLLLIRRIDTAEASRRLNDQIDRAVAALKQPPETRGQAWQAFLETLPDVSKESVGEDAFISADVLIDRLIDNKSLFRNMHRAQACQNTRQTLLDMLCAARSFELEHGRFASSPDDLVPKYLDAWPVDDFDRTPLEHRIVDDAWVIYSRLGDPEEPEDFTRTLHIEIGP